MRAWFLPFCLLLSHGAFAAVPARAPESRIPDKLWSERPVGRTGSSANSPVTMGGFSRLAKLISPAVVNISTVGGGSQAGRESASGSLVTSEGTGFFIHASGYLLTNDHVIDGARDITVRTATDRVFKARVIGRDPRTDLALLQVDGRGPFPIAPLGDSSKISPGEWVVAIGNPFGLSHTVTAGIVSAVGRSDVQPTGKPMLASFIQTDASINPGNSGGPLCNIRGEVIGINTAIRGDAQGIGFAIPSNMAKKLLPQLATGRVERSFLGLAFREVTPELAKVLKLERVAGAIVTEVGPGSPADQAGLRAGDVLTSFDGQPVRAASDLPWLAAQAGIHAKVPVELIRDGKTLSVQVQLQALPRPLELVEPPRMVVPPVMAAQATLPVAGLGVTIADLTATLRKRFGIVAAAGALIVAVDRGGPGDRAGMRVGDVVTRVAKRTVTNAAVLDAEVHAAHPDDVMSLLVQRGKQSIWVTPKRAR